MKKYSVYVGITNNCNAKCFTCNRQVLTNYQYNEDMSINTIKRILNESKKITYIGEMGDFIFHKDSLKITELTTNLNIPMNVDTIGNIHDDDYWKRMGRLIRGESSMRFMIDSLDETDPHRLIDNRKSIHNLKTFINAGGHAIVKTILFNFNKDSIDDMSKYFKDIGVSNYEVIKSRMYKESGKLAYPEKSTLELMSLLKNNKPKYCPWNKHDLVYINEFGEVKVCCHLVFEGIPFADKIDESIEKYIGNPMFDDIIDLYMQNRKYLNINDENVSIESALNNEFNQYLINEYEKVKICKFRCGISEVLQNKVFYGRKLF